MTKINRPDWDDYFKEIVLVTKKRSACERLQVGCLLVKDNRIISAGYNGFLPGCPHESIVRNNHEQATIHAEQNALNNTIITDVTGCRMYVTSFPCNECTKNIIQRGIKKLIYLDKPDNKNNKLKESQYLASNYMLQMANIELVHYELKGKEIVIQL